MHIVRLAVMITITLLLTTPRARAADPFTLTATSGTSVTAVSGSSIPDLINDAYNTQGQFANLAGKNFAATLRYGRLTNAATFTKNAAGTSATLAIPSQNFTKTFTAANQNDLQNQLEDFFTKNGPDEYARFLRFVNENSTLGISDGNPLASTALMADTGYNRFGLHPSYSPDVTALNGGFRLYARGGISNTDEADGWFAQGGFSLTLLDFKRVALVTANTFRYRDVQGAAIYQFASTWALPIQVIESHGDNSLAWQLTPAFVGGIGGSWDLAAGGVPIGGQLTSSLCYQFRDHLALVWASQIGFYEGLPIDIGDFESETDVSQQILKNGLQIVKDWNNKLFADVGVTYTNFLQDAFIQNYISPTAGIGFRFSDNAGLRIGYQGDFASDFTTHSATVSLYVER